MKGAAAAISWVGSLMGQSESVEVTTIESRAAESLSGRHLDGGTTWRRSVIIRKHGTSSSSSNRSSTAPLLEPTSASRRVKRVSSEYYCEVCGRYGACCVREPTPPNLRYLTCDCTNKVRTELSLRKAQHFPRYDRTEFIMLLDRIKQKDSSEIVPYDPDIATLYELYISAGTAIHLLKSKRGLEGLTNNVEDSMRAETYLLEALGMAPPKIMDNYNITDSSSSVPPMITPGSSVEIPVVKRPTKTRIRSSSRSPRESQKIKIEPGHTHVSLVEVQQTQT